MTGPQGILPPPTRNTWECLGCPLCGSHLDECAGELRCDGCRKSWPVVDGVPHFIDAFPYWGEIPLDEMKAVNLAARNGSWEAPLAGASAPDVARAAKMILNLERANWQWLVSLPRESRVLDLGAGMGTTSHALGLRFAEVIALEPVAERIEFMRHRFAQEGLFHVKPVRSSLWVLPFRNASFDLVAMNGVLEWVASGVDGDPAELQKAALKKAFRLLRSGGYFYLGIENRLSLGGFVGYPDPHCGVPWVTILPRRIANWYARRRGQPEGYRNYLYSAGGYRRLLEAAGFHDVDVYVALPSYNHPRFLMPLKNNVFDYYFHNFGHLPGKRRKRLVLAAALKTGLLKYCDYSFVILARK